MANKRLINYELVTSFCREGFRMERIDLAPTRVTQKTFSSIDMCCVSAEYIGDVNVQVLHTGISDHTGQLCSLNFEIRKKVPILSTRRHINSINLQNLRMHLDLQSWDRVLTCIDVDDAYNNFLAIVTSALDTTCLAKNTRQKPRKSITLGYDHEANQMKQEFIQAENSFKLNGRQEDKKRSSDLKKPMI
ncbi:hypothetical protein J6590_097509 [Homalodisca vitripennis]|nr:hypothetical protein J6590_097509 [Homalodisca vitripennis]